MTFSFLGAGGGSGSGVAVWQYLSKAFNNIDPTSSEFIEIWDPADPTLPEPASAHVLVYAQPGWKNAAGKPGVEDYPPSCGGAFGYKHYSQGEIPQKVYAWSGRAMPAYPYDYMDSQRFSGFNTTPSRTRAMMLPNCGGQTYFHRSDMLAPDAETHYEGDWTKVYNGGNGHWWDRGGGLLPPPNDGPGSSGSFFGRGYDGGHFPGGSGGPGTDTARGPTANKMADGLMDELGILKLFVKGKAQDSNHAESGQFEVILPPDLFLFGQLPFQHDVSLLKLPAGRVPGDRNEEAPRLAMTFAVILEFKQ